ncbi:DUF433 domain-containing protein [Nocardia blacklockiae]|uniref:DUF433 domain-containing protein n=1 Tax=Nocardia blacklockiae TaxID=480036 RepID=UPI002B4ACB19|nr:DUF433 domain-containing protein [Nocardia blacklockiae]
MAAPSAPVASRRSSSKTRSTERAVPLGERPFSRVSASRPAFAEVPLARGYHHAVSRITFDPNQLGGRPCIRGMRIRVKDVLELLAAGETEDSILEDFPYLEREDIRACLAFAAAEADHPILRTAS